MSNVTVRFFHIVQVAQAVAHALKCPVDNIKVRPNQGIISPNSWVTGGSSASELAMQVRHLHLIVDYII